MIEKYIEHEVNIYGYSVKKQYLRTKLVKEVIKEMRIENYPKKEIFQLLKDEMRIDMFAYVKFRDEINNVVNNGLNEKQVKCIFEIFEEDKDILFEDFSLLVNMYFDNKVEDDIIFNWFKVFNDTHVKKEHIEVL